MFNREKQVVDQPSKSSRKFLRDGWKTDYHVLLTALYQCSRTENSASFNYITIM